MAYIVVYRSAFGQEQRVKFDSAHTAACFVQELKRLPLINYVYLEE